MVAYSVPAETFAVEGDPKAVRASGRAYGRFAAVAAEAAAALRGLDSDSWVGSEGDQFRARAAELPPPLDTARGAFGQVAWALAGFADELEAARRQMAGVRDDAEHTFGSLARAEADQALATRVGQLQAAWDEHLAVAGVVRARLDQAARDAGAAIRAAGRASPTAGQGWLAATVEEGRRWAAGRLEDLKGFVAEHAAGLRQLAGALRWVGVVLVAVGAALAVVSFVAGLFSFGVGGVGALPAGLIMQAGFLVWGGGDALASTVDWAEGRITGRQLLVEGGLSIGLSLGGARLAKPALTGARRLLPRLQQWLRVSVLPLVRDQVVPRLPGPVGRAVEEWAEALRRRLPGASWIDPDGGWRLRVDGGDVLSLDRHASAAADALLDRARAAEPGLTSLMEDLSRHVDQAELVGLADRLKTPDSLKRALATELQRRPFLDPTDVLAGRIQDSVRYTVQLPPDQGYAAGVANAVAQLRRGGAESISWKWSWAGDGYKGINSTWRDPVSGHVFEVQFHTPDSFHAKSVTHHLYDQQRLPTTSPEEAARLAEEQAEIFRKVPVPPGVEDLLDRPP